MDLRKHIASARRMATLLDTKFSFLGIKFGVDPILDIIPGLGSIVGAITSTYLFWIAKRLNVGFWVYMRMLVNILLDLILGEIPVVGILFDVFYKSNIKNIQILEKYIKPETTEAEIISPKSID